MSYIYFIQAQDAGPIKVGVTADDPRKRMVKIQSDCPWPVTLLGTIKGSVAQEKQIHLVLARWRTQGEWFEPHPIVLAAVAEAIRCGDAVKLPSRKRRAKHVHPLCQHRADNGLTLRDLARQTGLTAAALSRFERGQNRPNEDSIRRLVRATGITAAQLRPDIAALMGVA